MSDPVVAGNGPAVAVMVMGAVAMTAPSGSRAWRTYVWVPPRSGSWMDHVLMAVQVTGSGLLAPSSLISATLTHPFPVRAAVGVLTVSGPAVVMLKGTVGTAVLT